jgi:hypothetical protein
VELISNFIDRLATGTEQSSGDGPENPMYHVRSSLGSSLCVLIGLKLHYSGVFLLIAFILGPQIKLLIAKLYFVEWDPGWYTDSLRVGRLWVLILAR